VDIPYLVGIGPPAVTVGDGAAAAERSTPEVRHAVAAAALVDGSDVAVALCGATVTVGRREEFSTAAQDGGPIHAVCRGLAEAAYEAARRQPGE
jgi:hypothetical protein